MRHRAFRYGFIAIELQGKPYAPILNIQYNIRHLIDPDDQKPTHTYSYTAFRELPAFQESTFNPYRYATKRFDPNLNLFYFPSRDYDPHLARWLTTDPAGFIDSMNLYAYVLNNPFRYFDPERKFVFFIAIPLLESSIPLIAKLVADAVVISTVTWLAVESHAATMHKIKEEESKKHPEVYAPDRPLPNSTDGVHIPDTDAPHTQLGTKEGRKVKYLQAREFDEQGNPVRDIDFTDHDRPQNHPNPHQHKHKPNSTGGTRI